MGRGKMSWWGYTSTLAWNSNRSTKYSTSYFLSPPLSYLLSHLPASASSGVLMRLVQASPHLGWRLPASSLPCIPDLQNTGVMDRISWPASVRSTSDCLSTSKGISCHFFFLIKEIFNFNLTWLLKESQMGISCIIKLSYRIKKNYRGLISWDS